MMDFSLLDERITDEDLYAVLGACETSTMDQIKAEFKYRAKKMHPDKLNKTEDKDDTQSKGEFNR